MSDTATPTPPVPSPEAPPASAAPDAPAAQAGRAGAERESRPGAAPPRMDRLPPYKVLLHNDDVTPMDDVVLAIRQITALNRTQAHQAMMTAHTRGVALLLVTHRERAELYVEQFRSRRLTASIEPA